MFNRVRTAIANAVSGFENQNPSTSSSQPNSVPLTPKFPYSRPQFLNLNLQEEVPLSADHRVRPIIVPRERDALPWCSGYAECVNAGKSLKNEDQASVYEFSIPISGSPGDSMDNQWTMDCTYFGMFDGHAGYGAAVSAARQLHLIIEEKLVDVAPMIWESFLGYIASPPSYQVHYELFILGAIERAFVHMDEIIAEDRDKYLAAGGCTALMCLFMLGKCYIANAGDSRVTHCSIRDGYPHGVQMSYDFTPETERARIRQLAEAKPELLGGEYTFREYVKPPTVQDLGKPILYKDSWMLGWSMKTITTEDLKMPVISGEGKRSRVMNTIGVTRGFGDHDLKAINSKTPIKPFLSCQPEVCMINCNFVPPRDNECVIMGTDGLWDVTENGKSAEIVAKILHQFRDERHKYISAAQALVANARGKPYGESFWRTSEGRMATADDVSCFVIPLCPHWEVHEKLLRKIGHIKDEVVIEDDEESVDDEADPDDDYEDEVEDAEEPEEESYIQPEETFEDDDIDEDSEPDSNISVVLDR